MGLQIILAVGFLEAYSEYSPALANDGEKHYLRGGKPGYYPSFKGANDRVFVPHPVPLNFWDPFNLTKRMKPEVRARRLNVEVNNGRLAMIGLAGFLAEAFRPGSVPALAGKVRPYSGPT